MTEIDLEFIPRKPFKPYLNRTERWACIVAHRRAGKTVACVMDLVARAIEHKGREPRFAYIAPTFGQAKDVAWTYLKEYTQAIPGMKVMESELSVQFPHNGARIRLYGAENYDRLRGLYLDGCVIDEAGDQDPRAFPEVIRPALSDRKGWATFIGTPKGRNEFHRIYEQAKASEDWLTASLRASQTGLIAESELADAKAMMTPEQYAQEYECSFNAAIMGAYYGRDMEAAEARIIPIAHDRSADVFCAWDLGIGDAMAMWFGQTVGKEIHWLAYYENSGFGLDHYVDYAKSRPFPVHLHLLPHDAEARELQTGQSRIDFLRGRGLDCRVTPRHGVDEGISAVRMKFPQMWFNSAGEGMARGLDCLRMYRAEYDDKNMTLKTRPLHDWASHGADSLRCGVMGLQHTAKVIVPRFKPRAVV
jgi:phage terminase large subunit